MSKLLDSCVELKCQSSTIMLSLGINILCVTYFATSITMTGVKE